MENDNVVKLPTEPNPRDDTKYSACLELYQLTRSAEAILRLLEQTKIPACQDAGRAMNPIIDKMGLILTSELVDTRDAK